MEALGNMLSRVDVYASCVLDSPFEETWQLARDFNQAPWWRQAGKGEFAVKRLGDAAPTEIGGLRVFKVGSSRLFEELTALDDIDHVLRWCVISHPSTISPFGQASFLNYTSSLQLRPITVSGQTFAEWKGQFFTESAFAEQMQNAIQGWYYAGFRGLQVCASSPPPQNFPHVARQAVGRATVLNPKASVPLKPPVSDQMVFTGPSVDHHVQHDAANGTMYPPYVESQNGIPDGRLTQPAFVEDVRQPMAQEPRMATQSSHAWQQARAAFGNPAAQGGRRTSGSGMAQTRPMQQPAATMSVPTVFLSDGSSGESSGRHSSSRHSKNSFGHPAYSAPERLVAESHSSLPSDPALHVHTGQTPASPQVPGRNNLDPIMESHSQQMNGVANAMIGRTQRPIGRASQEFGPASRSQNSRSTIPLQSTERSTSSNRASSNGGSAKAEQHLGLSRQSSHVSGHEHSPAHSPHAEVDLSSMKETAFVETEQDAKLMSGVADNMAYYRRHQERESRTSLEEEVQRLQERHRSLHRVRAQRPSQEKPYVSPFSAFEAAQSSPRAANPFATIQTPFS